MCSRLALISALCALLVACETSGPVTQFWRPVSEPNILMESVSLQKKLDFDLSQCHCGIYPANASHEDIVGFQPDHQRLAQTSVTITPDEEGQCVQKPSLVVTECMRQRGWEPTNCSGRMPVAGGGSICATYVQPGDNN